MAYNQDGDAEAGMGVVATDLDGDGLTDLFMTHLHEETHTAYRNLGADTGFEDATSVLGLGALSAPYTGFGVAALDLELNGRPDLVIANGRVKLRPPEPGYVVMPPWHRLAEPNQVFINQGQRFEELAHGFCKVCREGEISRGLAAGDIDNDGDTDLVIANINNPARLYINQSPRSGKP